MKRSDSIFLGSKGLILIVAVIAGGLLLVSAECRAAAGQACPRASAGQLGQVALVIQQMPAKGGTITPRAGIHHFAPNSQVTVTAMPQAGYQFGYWLGDVRDPAASSTTVFLDGPKVVIAVFEPVEQQYPAEAAPVSAGGAGGGSFASEGDYGWHGSLLVGGGKAAPDAQSSSRPTFPAAGVPEPATLILLGLGGLIFRTRR